MFNDINDCHTCFLTESLLAGLFAGQDNFDELVVPVKAPGYRKTNKKRKRVTKH
ncbi:MAG: hypothetical protein OXR68_05185 [Alphaproteobacteria bacterium]|nr:hypothetical protein [Alphaproteobacteria bacterium]MDD9919997.1 hypothetical protein [Alphaproteobacteria bacterium]